MCARKVKKYQIGALKDYDGEGNEAKQIQTNNTEMCRRRRKQTHRETEP